VKTTFFLGSSSVVSLGCGCGVEEDEGIVWSSIGGFKVLCVKILGKICGISKKQRERKRVPAIISAHTVAIIIMCQCVLVSL
jgi:hypothetical protein